MYLLVALLVACGGPPSEPPVDISAPQVSDAPGKQAIRAGFGLRDATGAATVAPGSLLVEITDRPEADTRGRGDAVCSGRAEVPVSAYDPAIWYAAVVVELEPVCPPKAPGIYRAARYTFTPKGGTALPVEPTKLSPWLAPSIAGPPPEPTPPAPPPEPVTLLRIDPWPVAVVAPGATVALDPAPTPVDPDGKIVTAPGCSAKVSRASERTIDGSTIRLYLAADGATFSVDDVTGDHWALQYEVSGRYGVNHGVVVGDWAYFCRGDYDTAAERACAAAVCASLRAG